MLNSDYRDILSALSAADARYLVVGAYALASHGLVRATSDIDIWVDPTPGNAERICAALLDFGAPREQVSAEFLSRAGQVLQLGVTPVRIDILTSISGVEFTEAWGRRKQVEIDGMTIPVLGLSDLITNKKATGRPQDMVDLDWIRNSQG